MVVQTVNRRVLLQGVVRILQVQVFSLINTHRYIYLYDAIYVGSSSGGRRSSGSRHVSSTTVTSTEAQSQSNNNINNSNVTSNSAQSNANNTSSLSTVNGQQQQLQQQPTDASNAIPNASTVNPTLKCELELFLIFLFI